MKKWISNGMDADYFVTAVRTGGAGAKGISLLIIARQGNEKNIITSRILTQGHHASHTTMIIFRDVRVPVSYLIGKERLAFALQTDPLGQTDKSIPANIALFKVQATKMLEFVAREGAQIHGGASYVEGKIIERIYRDVRAFAIYGGSEEIMLDVSLRLSKL
eukprot:UN09652